MTYSTGIHRDIGGDSITIDPSGKIVFGNVTFSVNAAGKLVVAGLPTTDTHVDGELWSNSGALTLSPGEA